MDDAAEQTSSDVVVGLKRDNLRLREEIAQLQLDLHDLKAMLRFLQGTRFAPSSERHVVDQPYLIPPSGEVDVAQPDEEPADETEVTGHTRKKKRQTLPSNVKKTVIQHDLEESEKVCPCHGTGLEKSGEKAFDQGNGSRPR